MKRTLTAMALATLALAAPSLARAAVLNADPAQRCYRETQTVLLSGSGFTANTRVDFSRDGVPLTPDQPIVADAAGALAGVNLTLPGLLSGQRRLFYLATDSANSATVAELSLLVTATDVTLAPTDGAPNRRLTIRARGFFGGKTLWAHVLRKGGKRARNQRIGRVRGACKKLRARRRFFRAGTAPGVYRVQFDTFRRYRPNRSIKSPFDVTITGRRDPAGVGAAGTGSAAGATAAATAWRPGR